MSITRWNNPLLLLLPLLLIGAVGCKEDDKQQKEITSELLVSKQWVVQSVSVDGIDKTSLYAGLKITFSTSDLASGEGTYQAQPGDELWPSTGTWKLTDDTGKTFVRGDGIEVQIDALTVEKMVMRLTWSSTTFGLGRLNSVAGEHVLTFQ